MLIGPVNVGKSTLFNKIIDIVNSESRGALVTMGEQKGLRLRRRIKKLHFDVINQYL